MLVYQRVRPMGKPLLPPAARHKDPTHPMSPMTTSFKSSKTEPRMGTKSSGTLATCNTWCQGSKGSKGSKGWKETTQGGEHLFDPLETMPSLLDSTLVSPWSSFRFNRHVRVLKISGPTCRFDIWTLSIYDFRNSSALPWSFYG
jgi:hypothetical protein